MSKRDRAAWIASSLLAAACGHPNAPPATVQPAEIDASVVTHPAPIAVDAIAPDPLFSRAVSLLGPYAFTHGAMPRLTLYTWTTRDQRAALKKSTRLLTREQSPDKGSAYLDQVIFSLANRGDPIAKILYTSTYARMRYAWHAPWATREGWPGEQYGDELIAVTLKPEAIILSLFTKTGTFTAQDLNGQPIALADVEKNIGRIAAIYFVSDATAPPSSPSARAISPRPTTTYRELALCNEWMIESWSLGTDAIAKELDENAAALEAFAAYLQKSDVPADLLPLAEAWALQPAREPIALYRNGLAFDNELYKPDAIALLAIATHLRAAPRGLALSHTPTIKFPGAGAPRALPVVKRAATGTFSTFGQP